MPPDGISKSTPSLRRRLRARAPALATSRAIAASAATAWAALRRVDKAQELFAPVLVDGDMEEDVRTVTFANGLVVRERIVAVDEERRRLVYYVPETCLNSTPR